MALRDYGNAFARALQLVGTTGRPQMQAGLLNQFQQEAERQRQQSQFGGLLNDMELSPQQRGILNYLGPQQAGPILARQAFAQPETQKPTGLMQNLDAMGLKRGTPEYVNAMRSVLMKPGVTVNTGAKLPIGFMWKDPNDPSKGVMPLKGGPAELGGPSKPFSQDQSISAGYANRMNKSEQRMKALVETGKVNPASAGQAAKEAVPYFGNFMTSSAFRRLRQAQNDWIRAKLRKESGAVIAQEEMESERRTYFPMPGDDPQTIAQKRQARIDAMQNLIAESQGAYGKMFKDQTAPSSQPSPDDNDPLGIR